MSYEDAELKDILAQTLESNGSLAKIRAQLRSCIYLAFDEDELMHNKQPLMNNKIQQKLETPVGKMMFKVVREFLEFLDLDYTISVYDSESYMGKEYDYEGRSKLLKDLNLEVNESVPILYELIKQVQAKSTQVKKQNGELETTFDMTSPTLHVDSPQPSSEAINPEKSTEPTRNILDSTINDFPLINKLSPQKVKNRSTLGEKTNGAELINSNSNYMGKDYEYEGRMKDLNLEVNESVPVLYELYKQAQAKSTQVKKQNGELDSTFDMTSPTLHVDSPQPSSEVVNPEKSTEPSRNILDSTINDLPFISKLSPQKVKNKTNGAELMNSNSNYTGSEDNYEEDFMSERDLKSDQDVESQDFEVDSNNVEDILQSK